MIEGLAFRPLNSERYPLPLTSAVYGDVPEPERVRQDVRKRLDSDTVALRAAVMRPGSSSSFP
jgi:hypothetical protein